MNNILIDSNRYRYDRILPNGRRQEWSGTFDSIESALQWFDKWGQFWKERGKELKLCACRGSGRVRKEDNKYKLAK